MDPTRFNVISSRVRFARNVQGIAYPGSAVDREKRLILPEIVEKILHGRIDADFFRLRDLDDSQIKALVERHLISPALVRNRDESAGIVEKNERLSFMINEEDHLREQCVERGFNLQGAYDRLAYFDDLIVTNLPIAYDRDYGFVTACPTNLGTGMRASTMVFLPALRIMNAIQDTVKVFTGYGFTIRGVYGEGSSAIGDTYQISNTKKGGTSEIKILEDVEKATEGICIAESVARERMLEQKGSLVRDKVLHSFNVLRNVYSLSSDEMQRLISDVKLGVICGFLPEINTDALDALTTRLSAASLTIKIGECAPHVRDITRAKLVRDILAEVMR